MCMHEYIVHRLEHTYQFKTSVYILSHRDSITKISIVGAQNSQFKILFEKSPKTTSEDKLPQHQTKSPAEKRYIKRVGMQTRLAGKVQSSNKHKLFCTIDTGEKR